MSNKRIPGPTIEEIRALNDGSTDSDISEAERRYLAMINGEKPRNKKEPEMQQEIIKMRKEGKFIDIPSM
jgi:hypothetical protein